MFEKKKKTKNYIIFDIGTGSIAGALVKFNNKNIPEILYIRRRPIKFKEGPKSTRIVSSMLGALDMINTELSNDIIPKHGAVDEIHCVLSGLWYISDTKIFHIKKRKPIFITESLFIDLIKSQKRNLSLKSFDVYNSKEKKIKIIEKNIIQTTLNGYKTSNPYMKKASNIEVSVFVSGASRNVLLEMEKTISKTFNIEEIKYHTFSYIASSSLRDIFENDDNFIFIDISGELTEVVIVKGGIFLESITFPIGKNSIVRSVSYKLKISLEEAVSKISLVYSGKLIEDESKKLIKSIKTFEKKWQNEVKKLILESRNIERLPKKIFFMSDDNFNLVFQKFIQNMEINDKSISKVDLVNDDLVDKYVKYVNNTKSDPFIGISSIFIGRTID